MFARTVRSARWLVASSRPLSIVAWHPQTTVQLEVERKFTPTADYGSHLNGQRGVHSRDPDKGLSHSRLPDKLIRDTYLDSDSQPANAGIWIRRRRELVVSSFSHRLSLSYQEHVTWQTKVYLSGDFVDSQFEEADGQSLAAVILSQHIPGMRLSDLLPTADLLTHRRTWDVSDAETRSRILPIQMMVDTVTEAVMKESQTDVFRHEIGEIEMTAQVEKGRSKIWERAVVEEMRKCVNGFMLRHKKLFSGEPVPVGKLSAYFEWKAATRAPPASSPTDT